MYEEERNDSFFYMHGLKYTVGKTTLAFGIFAVVYVISSLLLGKVAETVLPAEYLANQWISFLLNVVPLYGIAFPVMLCLLRGTHGFAPAKKKLSFEAILVLFPMGVSLMIIGNIVSQIVISYIARFFPWINQNDPVTELLTENGLLVTVILTLVVAPVMEELLFRKILLDRISPLGEGISILLSGFLFGALHCNLQQFFYATLFGMLLAFIYLKTGKVIYTMLLHMLINLFCGVLPKLFIGDWILALEGEEVVLTGEILMGSWRLLGYAMAEYAMAAIGLLLLILLRKEIKAAIIPSQYPKGYQFKTAFLSPGAIILLSLCMGVALVSLVLI